jgi:hypothetical protein
MDVFYYKIRKEAKKMQRWGDLLCSEVRGERHMDMILRA